MAVTRTETNIKNHADISITFDQVINAETDLGISPNVGDDPLAFDETQFAGTSTLIQYEPGSYEVTQGGSVNVGTGEVLGIESTTQNSGDVTFRSATDSTTDVKILSGSDAAGMYLGHITIDTRSNHGTASIELVGGSLLDGTEIIRDIQCAGWCDETAYKLETTAMDNGEKIIRNVVDERPIIYGNYSEDTTYSFFLGRGSTGFAQYDDIKLVEVGESGLYSGKDEAEVHVTNSYFKNVGYASVRLTGNTSTVDNCSFLIDANDLQADTEISSDTGPILNWVIWTQSSALNDDDGIRGGPTVENCDIVVETMVRDGFDRSGNGIITNHPYAGGITVKNTRIENNDSDSYSLESIDCADPTSGVTNPEATIDNVSLTGTFNAGQAVLEIEDRDGSTISNSCIYMPNNADGVESIGVNTTPTHTIEDSNINVGGTQFIEDGANQDKINITSDGTSCESPDLSSWNVDSGGEAEETYQNNFTNYNAGNTPSDWTLEWGSVDDDWNINSTLSNEGSQVLEMDTAGSEDRRALSWDAVGEAQDTEVLGLIKYPSFDNGGIGWSRLFARGSGTEGSEEGYFAGIGYNTDGSNYVLQIAVYDESRSPSFEVLENHAIPDYSDQWLWIRFRVNGTTLRTRYWEYNQDEPDIWDIGLTDSRLSSGWAGVGSFDDQLQSWDYIGVGVGGASAPMPADDSGIHSIQTVNSGSRRTVDGINQTRPIKLNVNTDEATNIGDTSATLNLELTELDAFYQSDLFFYWRQTGDPSWNVTDGTTVSSPTTFSENITPPSENTEYEFQGAAMGVGGQEHSDTGSILTFTTTGIITDGLQNRWNFEDDSDTTTAVDTIGTNDGTVQGDPVWDSTNNIIDNISLNLDGSGDYVDGMSHPLPNDADFTIMGWVDLPSSPTSSDPVLLSTGGSHIYGYRGNDNGVTFWHENGGYTIFDSGPDIRGAGESHIAVRRTGDTFELFVNGTLEDSFTETGNLGDDGSGMAIGAFTTGEREGEGPHDDIRYYNRALSDTEISDIANKQG